AAATLWAPVTVAVRVPTVAARIGRAAVVILFADLTLGTRAHPRHAPIGGSTACTRHAAFETVAESTVVAVPIGRAERHRPGVDRAVGAWVPGVGDHRRLTSTHKTKSDERSDSLFYASSSTVSSDRAPASSTPRPTRCARWCRTRAPRANSMNSVQAAGVSSPGERRRRSGG